MEKTAMQQLKEKLETVVSIIEKDNPFGRDGQYKEAIKNVIKEIDSQMMATEKGIIINAYENGIENLTGSAQYYSQTFEKT